VHAVLEAWMREDDCDPSRLRGRTEALLDDPGVHPMLRALWQPRLMEAIDFIGRKMAEGMAQGRRPALAEVEGRASLSGVELRGRVDRLDRCADGSLAIVDYKTGQPPKKKAVAAGFALQMGLLGAIAARGGFSDVRGVPAFLEYWSLARSKGESGFVVDAAKRAGMGAAEFVGEAERLFAESAATWLTGRAPFTAKLHPAFAPYGEYDQLIRLDEWYGRERYAVAGCPLQPSTQPVLRGPFDAAWMLASACNDGAEGGVRSPACRCRSGAVVRARGWPRCGWLALAGAAAAGGRDAGSGRARTWA
jgi:ATP-dependent helicase/nuclease subunit B